MSCHACELKRAKRLVQALIAVDCFNLKDVMEEMQYRWPNKFYVEHDLSESGWPWRIMQRNTVAPYVPNEVYRHVDSH